ncbi:phosphoribosylglycinamide formyltransferase [Helicobacter sp. 13S00401-1]|uniref:phosphoribosylglycinamide formyltransferase n=1 Tax=Helicobacter sp. 13S00401-1 TaxID=1905758 RepID=UPI000BA5896D|nr:phosphoribosylglycinamide formyltransferase [Helicobacter sp. 13S00401-1]PAF49366.1 phosphoribosylglycinamide formyltransferase [Helicobacter sp. 13S00401-1]
MTKPFNIVILISGTGSNALNLIEHFHNKTIFDKKVIIKKVISNNPSAKGLFKAQEKGVDTFVLNHKDFIKREDFDSVLASLVLKESPNLVLLAGFMRVLSEAFLSKLDIPILNIHPSYLPLHKGAHAIKDSFNDSNDFGGVSVHYVSKELDSGTILLQEKIKKACDIESFEKDIHTLEYKLYVEAVLKVLKGS